MLIRALFKFLSQIKFLAKSEVRKFLFVAVLGINFPLVGLLVFFLYEHLRFGEIYIFLTVTFSILVSTTITVLILKQLLEPLVIAKDALEIYLQKRQLITLPTDVSLPFSRQFAFRKPYTVFN